MFYIGFLKNRKKFNKKHFKMILLINEKKKALDVYFCFQSDLATVVGLKTTYLT